MILEKDICLTKIGNFYIVNDLDSCPKSSLNTFILKNVLFRATNIVTNSAKIKYIYSSYGIAFNEASSWNLGHDFNVKVIIFGYLIVIIASVNLLVLGEEPTDDINGSFCFPEQKFSINFSKAKAKFCLSLHYNGDNTYLFVNGKKSKRLKLMTKI